MRRVRLCSSAALMKSGQYSSPFGADSVGAKSDNWKTFISLLDLSVRTAAMRVSVTRNWDGREREKPGRGSQAKTCHLISPMLVPARPPSKLLKRVLNSRANLLLRFWRCCGGDRVGGPLRDRCSRGR